MSRDLTKFVLKTPFSTHTAQEVNRNLWKVMKKSKVKGSMNCLYSKPIYIVNSIKNDLK